MKIYKLIDPITKDIRYIGKTNGLEKRFYSHVYWASKDKRNQHVYNWIRKLLEENLKPIIQLVEDNLTENEAIDKEIFWIKYYRDKGFNLTNENDGGLGFGLSNKVWVGRKHTEETKKKIRIGNTGKVFSTETRLKISFIKNKKTGILNYKSINDRGYNPKPINVFNIDTKKKLYSFSSILECSKVLNLNRGYIKKCLDGKRKQYLNFSFHYK